MLLEKLDPFFLLISEHCKKGIFNDIFLPFTRQVDLMTMFSRQINLGT